MATGERILWSLSDVGFHNAYFRRIFNSFRQRKFPKLICIQQFTEQLNFQRFTNNKKLISASKLIIYTDCFPHKKGSPRKNERKRKSLFISPKTKKIRKNFQKVFFHCSNRDHQYLLFWCWSSIFITADRIIAISENAVYIQLVQSFVSGTLSLVEIFASICIFFIVGCCCSYCYSLFFCLFFFITIKVVTNFPFISVFLGSLVSVCGWFGGNLDFWIFLIFRESSKKLQIPDFANFQPNTQHFSFPSS